MRTIRGWLEGLGSAKRFEDELEELVDGVKQTNERTFRANDAVEAWAFLMVMVDAAGAVAGDHRARARAIYRGQSNASWKLLPTLTRLDEATKNRAMDEASHFAKVANFEFRQLSEMDSLVPWPPVHSESGRAAAQHFGMCTTLLDWSSSYSVALDFATKRADGGNAAIWWLRLSNLSEFTTVRVILPPPFVERLYLQRGVFTEARDHAARSAMENKAYKIEFPAKFHERVKGFVDGKMIEMRTLETPSPWFETLAEYCQSSAGQKAFDELKLCEPLGLDFAVHKERVRPTALSPCQSVALDGGGLTTGLGGDRLLRQIPEHLLALGQRTFRDGTIGLDEQVMGLLRRENAELLDWAVAWLRALVPEQRT